MYIFICVIHIALVTKHDLVNKTISRLLSQDTYCENLKVLSNYGRMVTGKIISTSSLSFHLKCNNGLYR